MSTPFLSEIRLISFNFPPRGWTFANGQLLPINQNQALFSLLGTTYGGNGQTNFALPNLQARSATHFGTGGGGTYTLGQTGGEVAHTLTVSEMAAHTHSATVSTAGGTHVPDTASLPGTNAAALYDPSVTANTAMAAGVIGNAGGSQPHENLMPYLSMYFIIALQGIFPSQN